MTPVPHKARSRELSRRWTRALRLSSARYLRRRCRGRLSSRARGVSVIAFSTDSSVAGRGVYLLSFLPESDVNRIVEYSASAGKRSFAALLPENAYGNVVEASFKQAVGRRGGRIVAFERYSGDRATAARTVAQGLGSADALFIPADGDSLLPVGRAFTPGGP